MTGWGRSHLYTSVDRHLPGLLRMADTPRFLFEPVVLRVARDEVVLNDRVAEVDVVRAKLVKAGARNTGALKECGQRSAADELAMTAIKGIVQGIVTVWDRD